MDGVQLVLPIRGLGLPLTSAIGNAARPRQTAARSRASCWAAGPYRCTRSPTDHPALGGVEVCWFFVHVRAPRVLLHGNPEGLSGTTTTTGCEKKAIPHSFPCLFILFGYFFQNSMLYLCAIVVKLNQLFLK